MKRALIPKLEPAANQVGGRVIAVGQQPVLSKVTGQFKQSIAAGRATSFELTLA